MFGTSLPMNVDDANGDTGDEDLQWLVTLALDGIWSSVTEVGPTCPTQPPSHMPIVSWPLTFPQYAMQQSPNPTDVRVHLLMSRETPT